MESTERKFSSEEKNVSSDGQTHNPIIHNLNIGDRFDWCYALPAPLHNMSGGTLEITEQIVTTGKFIRLYRAKSIDGSKSFFVKYHPDSAVHSSKIKAIPYTLKEKGRFFSGQNEYLVFDAFDGSFSDIFHQDWFTAKDPDSKIRLVGGVVLRQLLAAMNLYPRSKYNFDFKPGNVLYRLLPDGSIEIMLIDMTESIISGDAEIVPGLYLLPMATDNYIAPAFTYFFARLAERDTLSQADENRMKMAKSVIHLSDIYTLGIELYYFLSEGGRLIEGITDESFREWYHEGEGSFSVPAEKLCLLENTEERAEMAEVINLMISWKNKTPEQLYPAHLFCEEAIRALVAVLQKYGQLPPDVVIPADYLPRFDNCGGTDIVLKISNSISDDGTAQNDWTEYQTVFLREGEVCEMTLSLYNRHPDKENYYREKLRGELFLLVHDQTVMCRKDGEWLELPPGVSFEIDTKNNTHTITIERIA